jgi:hypothetical protein
MVALVVHEQFCPLRGHAHSDPAKRLSDTYRLHRDALGRASIGKWFSAMLATGESNGDLYDTKADAVRHAKHNERWMVFVSIKANDMNVCEAEGYLAIQRKLGDANIRVADPDSRHGGMDLIPRVTREDVVDQMLSLDGGRVRPRNRRN